MYDKTVNSHVCPRYLERTISASSSLLLWTERKTKALTFTSVRERNHATYKHSSCNFISHRDQRCSMTKMSTHMCILVSLRFWERMFGFTEIPVFHCGCICVIYKQKGRFFVSYTLNIAACNKKISSFIGSCNSTCLSKCPYVRFQKRLVMLVPSVRCGSVSLTSEDNLSDFYHKKARKLRVGNFVSMLTKTSLHARRMLLQLDDNDYLRTH